MMCQNCNKKEATCHYKETVNLTVKELYLCSECASALGYDELLKIPFNQLGFGLDSFLPTLLSVSPFEAPAPERLEEACPLCGATKDDIIHSGRVGCAKCYSVFDDMLAPYIRRIHGSSEHAGQIPVGAADEIRTRGRLSKLRTELEEAIHTQEFERAAELRDEIRRLEAES